MLAITQPASYTAQCVKPIVEACCLTPLVAFNTLSLTSLVLLNYCNMSDYLKDEVSYPYVDQLLRDINSALVNEKGVLLPHSIIFTQEKQLKAFSIPTNHLINYCMPPQQSFGDYYEQKILSGEISEHVAFDHFQYNMLKAIGLHEAHHFTCFQKTKRILRQQLIASLCLGCASFVIKRSVPMSWPIFIILHYVTFYYAKKALGAIEMDCDRFSANSLQSTFYLRLYFDWCEEYEKKEFDTSPLYKKMFLRLKNFLDVHPSFKQRKEYLDLCAREYNLNSVFSVDYCGGDAI